MRSGRETLDHVWEIILESCENVGIYILCGEVTGYRHNDCVFVRLVTLMCRPGGITPPGTHNNFSRYGHLARTTPKLVGHRSMAVEMRCRNMEPS